MESIMVIVAGVVALAIGIILGKLIFAKKNTQIKIQEAEEKPIAS